MPPPSPDGHPQVIHAVHAAGDAKQGWDDLSAPRQTSFVEAPRVTERGASTLGLAYVDFLVANMLRISILGPDFFKDQLRSRRQKAVPTTANFESLRASSKFASAMTRAWYRCFFLLIGAFLAGSTALRIRNSLSPRSGLPRFLYYRFQTLETRGGLAPTASGISGFGIHKRMQDPLWAREIPHCQKAREGQVVEQKGAATVFKIECDYGCGSAYNGWYFLTGGEDVSVADDPVRFEVKGSDDLLEWRTIGTSRFVRSQEEMVFHPEVRFATPEARGALSVFTHHTRWSLMFEHFGYMTFGVGLMLNAWVGAPSRVQYLQPVFYSYLSLMAVLGWISAILFFTEEARVDPTVEHTGATVTVFIVIVHAIAQPSWGMYGLVYLNSYPDVIMFVVGILNLTLIGVAREWDAYGLVLGLPKGLVGIWPGILTILCSVVFLWKRFQRFQKMVALLRADKALYDVAWEQIVAEHDLAVLEDRVAAMTRRTRGKRALQIQDSNPDNSELVPLLDDVRKYVEFEEEDEDDEPMGDESAPTLPANSQPLPSLPRPPTWVRGFGADAPASPWRSLVPGKEERVPGKNSSFVAQKGVIARIFGGVNRVTPLRAKRAEMQNNLDVLYNQASVLELKLLLCAVRHADRSSGLFCMAGTSPPQFVEWKDVNDPETLELGSLKPLQRCVEKIDLYYSMDASRICDLCRQRVVFETPKDMASFLDSLGRDENISIVRVKSNMQSNPKGSSVDSGYRYVLVNLQIRDEDTVRLCASRHVCELILELKHFAEIRTEERHERYILHRNLPAVKPKLPACLSRFFGLFTGRRDSTTQQEPSAEAMSRTMSRTSRLSDHSFESSKPENERIYSKSLSSRHLQNQTSETPILSDLAPPAIVPGPSNAILNCSTTDAVATPVSQRTAISSVEMLEFAASRPRRAKHRSSATLDSGSSMHGTQKWRWRPEGGTDTTRGTASFRTFSPFTVSGVRDGENQAVASTARGRFVGDADGVSTSWGEKIPWETFKRLETLMQVVARGLCGNLDKELRSQGTVKSDEASFMSIFFTKKPVTYATSKRFWQCFFSLMLVPAFFSAIIGSQDLTSGSMLVPTPDFRHYRFVSLETRSGSTAQTPGVSAFGIVKHGDGCLLGPGSMHACGGTQPSVAANVSIDANSYTLSFSEKVRARGWYFVTAKANGSLDEDPALYEVQGRNDDEEDGEWKVFGRPTTKTSLLGRGFAMLAIRKEAPAERGALVISDSNFSIPLICWKFLHPLAFLTGGAGLILFGVFGISRHATKAFLVPLFFSLLFVTSASWGFGALGDSRAAAQCALRIPGLFGFFMSLLQESSCRKWFFFIFVTSIPCKLVTDFIVFEGKQGLTLGDPLGWLILALFTSLSVLRMVAQESARRVIKDTKAQYDTLWQGLNTQEDVRQSLMHLQRVVDMIGLDDEKRPKGAWRHYMRQEGQVLPLGHVLMTPHVVFQRHSSVLRFLEAIMLPNTPNTRKPLTSLDQLYAQAYVTHGLLSNKAKQWALGSRGMFMRSTHAQGANSPARGRTRQDVFVRWEEVLAVGGAGGSVQESEMKRKQRAVQKIMRVYGNDVSMLRDCARASIVFEEVQDLTICLGEIAIDKDVHIERVKNRLSLGYNAAGSAGYRDVAINLRITSPLAVALGIELHVCEVQLLLKSFAEIKQSSGHKNYVKFRDSRAT